MHAIVYAYYDRRYGIDVFCRFVCSMSYYGTVLNIDNLAGDLYLNFVLMVLVEFPAKAVAIYFLDRIGRKKMHIAFMMIGGIASTGTIFPILYGNGSK